MGNSASDLMRILEEETASPNTVLIFGLQSRPELNGTFGEICGPTTNPERVAILLKDTNTKISLKKCTVFTKQEAKEEYERLRKEALQTKESGKQLKLWKILEPFCKFGQPQRYHMHLFDQAIFQSNFQKFVEARESYNLALVDKWTPFPMKKRIEWKLIHVNTFIYTDQKCLEGFDAKYRRDLEKMKKDEKEVFFKFLQPAIKFDYYYIRMRLCMGLELFEEASEIYEKANEILNLGEMGTFNEIMFVEQKRAKLKNSYIDALIYETQDPNVLRDVIVSLKELIKFDPIGYVVLQDIAQCYFYLKEFDRAMEYCEKAMELTAAEFGATPNFGSLFSLAKDIYIELGDVKNAKKYFRRAERYLRWNYSEDHLKDFEAQLEYCKKVKTKQKVKANFKDIKRKCSNPSCMNIENDQDKFKGCSRCQSVFYCGRDCQKNHWKAEHKKKCKIPTQ